MKQGKKMQIKEFCVIHSVPHKQAALPDPKNQKNGSFSLDKFCHNRRTVTALKEGGIEKRQWSMGFYRIE